jgi:hypothetical protein
MHADDITQVHRTDRLEDRFKRIEHRLDIHDHEHKPRPCQAAPGGYAFTASPVSARIRA